MRCFIIVATLSVFALLTLLPRTAYALGFNFPSKKLSIEIDGTAAEKFDDNATLAKTNKKRDFITDLTAAIRAKYEGKRQRFDLTGRSVEHIYARNSSFTNNSQDATFNYQADLTQKDRITFKDAFSHYEDPSSFEDAFGRAGGRYGTIRNKMDADYVRDFGKQIQTDLGYSNQFYIFTKDRGGQRNSMSNQARAGGTYLFDSNTQCSLWYNFENRNFDGLKNKGFVQTILAGLRRYLTKQLYLDLQGGVDLIRLFGGKNVVKPAMVASLVGDLNERTQLSFSFMKRDQTSGYNVDIFNYWQISADLKRQLWKRLKAALSIFYGQGDYNSLDIKDHFLGWNTGLDYDIWHNIKGSLLYTFYRLDSNPSSRDYTRNVVSLKFTVTF